MLLTSVLKLVSVVLANTKLKVFFGFIHDLYSVTLASVVTYVYVNNAPFILLLSVLECVILPTNLNCSPFELS